MTVGILPSGLFEFPDSPPRRRPNRLNDLAGRDWMLFQKSFFPYEGDQALIEGMLDFFTKRLASRSLVIGARQKAIRHLDRKRLSTHGLGVIVKLFVAQPRHGITANAGFPPSSRMTCGMTRRVWRRAPLVALRKTPPPANERPDTEWDCRGTALRQSRGSARTELTHRVEIAHRPQVERRRLQARALEGCTHSIRSASSASPWQLGSRPGM